MGKIKLEAADQIYTEKGRRGEDDFIVLEFLPQPGITDLTRLQTSALIQDINFQVSAIFSSSSDGAQREGAGGKHEAWAKAEEGLCEPEWQWMMAGGELRANEALT